MRDAGAEGCLGREVLRQVDRIAVSGHLGEADDIRGVDGLLQRLGEADREVLEIQHL